MSPEVIAPLLTYIVLFISKARSEPWMIDLPIVFELPRWLELAILCKQGNLQSYAWGSTTSTLDIVSSAEGLNVFKKWFIVIVVGGGVCVCASMLRHICEITSGVSPLLLPRVGSRDWTQFLRLPAELSLQSLLSYYNGYYIMLFSQRKDVNEKYGRHHQWGNSTLTGHLSLGVGGVG